MVSGEAIVQPTGRAKAEGTDLLEKWLRMQVGCIPQGPRFEATSLISVF